MTRMNPNRGVMIRYTDRENTVGDPYITGNAENQERWIEADMDLRFTAGDQEYWNLFYGSEYASQGRMFQFNRMRRVREMITGYQRQHRKSLICVPIEGADQKTADQLTRLFQHITYDCSALEYISQAFDVGAVTTGEGLLSVYIDYTNDPVNGDIKVGFVPWCDYVIDPYWTRMDLMDCGYIERRKWLPKDEVHSILPDYEEEIEGLTFQAGADGRYPYQPQVYNAQDSKLFYVDECWYKCHREQKVLIDLRSGENVELKEDEESEEVQFLLASDPYLALQKRTIPTVKTRVSVNGKEIYSGGNLYGLDRYPFIPFIGYRDPSIASSGMRSQGVMRNLRDAQYLLNRRKNIELDILESQPNSGYFYKTSALENPEDIFLTGQGRGIALKDDAEIGRDVMKIPTPDIPQALIELSNGLAREIQEISGVSEELLGVADDEIAGVLSKLRQAANLTTLQKLFDQLDWSLCHVGKLWIDMIKEHYSPQKIERIVREQPTAQITAQTYGKYDIRVEEGLNTETQRQMQFAQAVQLKQIDPAAVSTRDLIELSTMQNKDLILQNAMEAQQQQQQQEQEQKAMQIRLLQAQAKQLEAQAQADEGLGIERLSRIQENRASALEKLMEAVHRDEEAVLDVAKAIKELDGMSLEQILAQLKILDYIQNQNKAEEVPTPGLDPLGTQTEL